MTTPEPDPKPTPDGVLGYAKALAAFATAILVVLVPFFPIDSAVVHWIQAALAVCGAIAVYTVPNAYVTVKKR